MIHISGPVSIYVGLLNGVKYYLIGDQHGSLANSCPTPCIENCYTIVNLIKYLIAKHRQTDVFLEGAMVKTTKADLAWVKSQAKTNYLQQVQEAFYDCFNPTTCPYKNARFQYIDLRAVWDPRGLVPTSLISGLIPLIKETYLAVLNYQPTPKYFARLNQIMRDLFGANNINQRVLDLMFNSDNYLVDLKNVLRNYPELISGADVLVYHNGRLVQHEIRHQLAILEKQNPLLAEQLYNFIREEQRQMDPRLILNSWYNLIEFAMDRHHLAKEFDYYLVKYNLRDIWFQIKDHSSREDLLVSLLPNMLMRQGEALIENLLDQELLVVDSYLLAQLLHKTGDAKIVFAGFEHIYRYVKFFRNLGVKFMESDPTTTANPLLEPQRCLTVSATILN